MIGLPLTSIAPELGVSSPAIMFITVDLPQPEGPTTQMNSPGQTSRVTSDTARVRWPVRGATKYLKTFLSRSLGVAVPSMAQCLQGIRRCSARRNNRSIRSATTPTTIMHTTMPLRSIE